MLVADQPETEKEISTLHRKMVKQQSTAFITQALQVLWQVMENVGLSNQ
jgi:hypothetical protein